MSQSDELLIENKKLKRKLRVMEQTITQFSSIKTSYDGLIKKLEEKDKRLLEMNERLEVLVGERTKELEEINEKLKALSITDSLTGLKNRRAFDETFSQEFNRARRQEYEFNLLVIDVDNFKKYNDKYGHKNGDFVLSQIGQILEKFSRRSNDFVFRYGGEEFVYISCFHDKVELFKTAESIRKAIQDYEMPHVGNPHKVVTVSIGAVVSTDLTKSKEDLFNVADDNLYKSKEEGRNRTTITICE